MTSLATTEVEPLCDSIDTFFASVLPPQRPSTSFWRKASSTAPEKASPFTTKKGVPSRPSRSASFRVAVDRLQAGRALPIAVEAQG